MPNLPRFLDTANAQPPAADAHKDESPSATSETPGLAKTPALSASVMQSELLDEPKPEAPAGKERWGIRALKPGVGSRPVAADLAIAGLFVGAVFVGGLLLTPPPAPVTRTVREAPVARVPVIPASQVFTVAASGPARPIMLAGSLQRRGVVAGEAPLSGQVTRVLVRPGQQVQVNDRILTLSVNTEVRAPRRAEARQNAAESEQVAAVRRKESLERRIERARRQYGESLKRVEAANKRLDAAKTLLAKIRSGEIESAPAPASRKARAVQSGPKNRAGEEHKGALAEASRDQSAADAATKEARAAFHAASSAESAARLKQGRIEIAQGSLRKAEEQFAAGAIKAAELDAARAGVSEAESEAAEAQKKADTARAEAARAERQASEARETARKSVGRAAQALQKLKLAEAEPEKAAEAEEPEADSGFRGVALAQAVGSVRSAIEESEAAARNVRRWKREIDSYRDTVNDTSSTIQNASEGLAQAQQQVLDNEIRLNLSSVRAPASGTVLSVADVSDNVSAGETVVRIGRGVGMEVVFADTSGVWRQMKEGMTLPARAMLPSNSRNREPRSSSSATSGRAVPRAAEFLPVMLRIQEVDKPLDASDRRRPVEVRAMVSLPEEVRRLQKRPRLRHGMSIVCPILPAGRSSIAVPESAVLPGNGSRPLVGVLQTAPDAEKAQGPASGASVETVAGGQGDVQVLEGGSGEGESYRVEWRPVALGAEVGGKRKIVSGLLPGERILMQAGQWRRWSQSNGPDAVVRLGSGRA
jgi:hypothetical protein